MNTERIDGILVVDKERGPTSHDVVAILRRALRTREVGHAGTLDPRLTAHDKTYDARILLGVETDTWDALGLVTRREDISPLIRCAIRSLTSGATTSYLATALDAERTRTEQVPPSHSAIHHDGERAYVRARRGEQFELPARPVRVHELGVLGCTENPPTLNVRLKVDKGYYVRSFARDLGVALGTIAHLTSLRRVRSGQFFVDEAIRIDRPPEALRAAVLPLAQAASLALPVANLTESGAVDAFHGRTIASEQISATTRGPCAWIGPAGQLIAVGHLDENGRGHVLRGFR
jgi:tRNA pseudouridine55 synthase